MEGYDEEWIDAGTRRFVSYTNLPIGSYTFRVLGSNNDGIWNEVGASYKLTILPPWYRTYFAYISYILFLIFGFRSFGRYQAKKSLEKAENERRAGELEEAKELQNSLLPKVLPNVTGFEISTYLKPATEIGGDYYDFFYEKDNYFYAICGDATGHGVVSGIMVSVTKAGLNGIPMGNPSTILGQLNRIVKRVNFGRLRMSLSVAKFNESSVELSSAAMPPTYFFSSKSKKIEEVLVPNLPLGGIEGEKFDGIKKEFDSGDVMVMISDGLPELPNPTDEMLDYEKVYSCIKNNAEKSADEIKDALVYLSDDWAKGVMNPDDITIVVIKKAA
jgi:sigma-B regulation protein RsbU (phosphoserine phosphatase)